MARSLTNQNISPKKVKLILFLFLELCPYSNFAKASNPYTWSFEGGPHHGKSYRVFAYILTLGRNVEQDET